MVWAYNVWFVLTVSIFHWSRCCNKNKTGTEILLSSISYSTYSGWRFLNKNLYSFILLLKVMFLIIKPAITSLLFTPQDFRWCLTIHSLLSLGSKALHLLQPQTSWVTSAAHFCITVKTVTSVKHSPSANHVCAVHLLRLQKTTEAQRELSCDLLPDTLLRKGNAMLLVSFLLLDR